MRALDPAVITELPKGTIRPAFFVETTFESTTLRVWSGVGNKLWNSQTWLGGGNLLPHPSQRARAPSNCFRPRLVSW